MNKSTLIIIVVVILLVAGGAYWYFGHGGSEAGEYGNQATTETKPESAENSSTMAPAATATDSAAPADSGSAMSPVLKSATSASLGSFLTASNGMTLYKYTKDTPGVSNCSGDCAVKWPPYTVHSAADLAAVTGISGKLATITRADGSLQVTYNGTPLYFWYQDSKPGDTNGQGVGGVWYVVQP